MPSCPSVRSTGDSNVRYYFGDGYKCMKTCKPVVKDDDRVMINGSIAHTLTPFHEEFKKIELNDLEVGDKIYFGYRSGKITEVQKADNNVNVLKVDEYDSKSRKYISITFTKCKDDESLFEVNPPLYKIKTIPNSNEFSTIFLEGEDNRTKIIIEQYIKFENLKQNDWIELRKTSKQNRTAKSIDQIVKITKTKTDPKDEKKKSISFFLDNEEVEIRWKELDKYEDDYYDYRIIHKMRTYQDLPLTDPATCEGLDRANFRGGSTKNLRRRRKSNRKMHVIRKKKNLKTRKYYW
jgi:hypothetical protein